MGSSRAHGESYYERTWGGRHRQARADEAVALIGRLRRQMPRLGVRKLYHRLHPELERLGVGRDTLFKLLRERGLLVARHRRYTKTTNSQHWLKKYTNLVKDLPLERPEQVFVSDITYIATEEGYNYLSLVTDACSKKIMGHALREDLSPKGCLEALTTALGARTTDGPLIHHSDRGFQYCSKDYVECLRKHGVRISMTEGGDPYENAIAERVDGILKEEFYLGDIFRSHEQAARQIDQAIEIYNRERPHLSCQMMTPEEAHRLVSLHPKGWKRIRKKGTQEKPVSPESPT